MCRRHHRLKTHGRWRYHPVVDRVFGDHVAFVWTSPHGATYTVDDTGTHPGPPDH